MNYPGIQNLKNSSERSSSHSIAVFITLVKYFLKDPDRPSLQRILINSFLLLGAFSLNIIALFGLPLAFLAIISAKGRNNEPYSLSRIGLDEVSVSPLTVVWGYLGLYLLGVVLAFCARKMLVRDNVNYIKRLTDSISFEFDDAIRRNLLAPGIVLDRTLFNRLSLSSSRALPRIHLTILNGVMPAIFGLLSIGVLMLTDFYLGIFILIPVVLSVPILLKSTDKSIKRNQEHKEDSRKFSESFRVYMGDSVFVSEVERVMRDDRVEIGSHEIETVGAYHENQKRFYESFEQKQTAADDARLIVGIVTLVVLAMGFFYFMYVPWSSVNLSAMFVLVLGFRYFIVALNGLASSFVSLTAGYDDLVEILTFREAISEASRRQEAGEEAHRSIEAFDISSNSNCVFDVFGLDMLEVIVDKPLTHANALFAFSQIVAYETPRYLSEVAAIGFPGRNYQKKEQLQVWIEENIEAVKDALGVQSDVQIQGEKELKLAFEDEYFAARKLKLPENIWALLCEWSFYKCSLSKIFPNTYLVINGMLLAALPQVSRDIIINQEKSGGVIVLYEKPPAHFVSKDETRCLILRNAKVFAVDKATSFEENLTAISIKFEDGEHAC